MNKYSSTVVTLVAIVALIISIASLNKNGSSSLADKVVDQGEIRIGYIVYPPLLYKDEATGKLSGVSYDLVESAAHKLGLKTKWVEEVGWGSAIEGLKTKRYDILGTQMWPNSARAREAVFSIAPMNSVLYAYVRTGDHRFDKNMALVNSPSVTVSALDGEMGIFIAKEEFPQAKINALPQLSSYAEVFLNVVNRKADLVFAEPSTVYDFLRGNPGTISRVGNTPLRVFGNSFAFVRGEEEMVLMWNIALQELLNDGTVARTLAKYGVGDAYVLNR